MFPIGPQELFQKMYLDLFCWGATLASPKTACREIVPWRFDAISAPDNLTPWSRLDERIQASKDPGVLGQIWEEAARQYLQEGISLGLMLIHWAQLRYAQDKLLIVRSNFTLSQRDTVSLDDRVRMLRKAINLCFILFRDYPPDFTEEMMPLEELRACVQNDVALLKSRYPESRLQKLHAALQHAQTLPCEDVSACREAYLWAAYYARAVRKYNPKKAVVGTSEVTLAEEETIVPEVLGAVSLDTEPSAEMQFVSDSLEDEDPDLDPEMAGFKNGKKGKKAKRNDGSRRGRQKYTRDFEPLYDYDA